MKQFTLWCTFIVGFGVGLLPVAFASSEATCWNKWQGIQKAFQQGKKIWALQKAIDWSGRCDNASLANKIRQALIQWSTGLGQLDSTINALETKMRQNRNTLYCLPFETGLRMAQAAFRGSIICAGKSGCPEQKASSVMPIRFCPGFKGLGFRRIAVEKRHPHRDFRCRLAQGFRRIAVVVRRPKPRDHQIPQWRQWLRRQFRTFSIKIQFRYNHAGIDPQQMALLESVSQGLHGLLKKGDRCIWIIGHTDGLGKFSDNLRLSNARARNVAKALAGMGLSMQYFQTAGVADTQPVATNQTPDGQASNRRVEFVLMRE